MELARRIAFDRAGWVGGLLPNALLEMLERLDTALKSLAAMTLPALVQETSENPVLGLFKEAEGSSFGRVLGARPLDVDPLCSPTVGQ